MSIVMKVAKQPRIAAVAALVLVGAFSGVAIAGSPYTVHVKVVPKAVPLPGKFKVTASGMSANTSWLRVLLNAHHVCASTAKTDASFAGDTQIIAKQVTGVYSASKTETASKEGQHHACAYLTSLGPSFLPRAHASFVYTVG
jgi:hypothetical protein